MPDILTPEQVEAIRERLLVQQRREFGPSWNELVPTEGRTLGWIIESIIDDAVTALLADHDALTARAEAAEVAAVLEDVHATLDEQKGDSDDHHGAHPGAPER